MNNENGSSKNSGEGESSRDASGRFLKGTHWRKHRKFREKDFLVEEYINKKRSCSDIAKDFGVTDGAISFWLIKHGIKRRTTSEVRSVKHWGCRGKSNPMYGKCGSSNPRWIDGSSPLRQRMYARSFWKELAKAVYERDGFKCVRCGCSHTSKNKLHAHHIKPWAGNADARFDLANIVTLCCDCHWWVHSNKNTNNEYLA